MVLSRGTRRTGSKGFTPSLVALNIFINCYCGVSEMAFALCGIIIMGSQSERMTTLMKEFFYTDSVVKALLEKRFSS
ncbi:hypothetical protein K1719_007577 [Acacia pycnantha]|nr:hypothetical protein K1719_007577 [Acacia pycnantha]